MNNGNFLNSLLGMTGANPAATKTNSAKARAESSEKFQQALEQARPEVAARKTVVRKETAKAEPSDVARPAPKPTSQRYSQQETSRADTRPQARVGDDKIDNNANNHDSSMQDLNAEKPANTNQTNTQAADTHDQTFAAGNQQVEGQEKGESVLTAIENLLLVDPVIVSPGQSGEFLGLPEGLPGAIDGQLSATGNDIETLLNPDEVTDNSILLQAQNPLVTQSPLPSLIPEVSTDTVGDSASPLMASNQPALGALVPGQVITPQVIDGPLTIQVGSGGLTGKVIDELALNANVAKPATEGELSVDTETGENPDFLLLNSKAALNKLAEATMTAANVDKAAPADAAKPALISAAVESLTRLTEAQSPAARAFVVQTGVPVTVGSPQWSQAVGDKVLWLAAQNVSSAEIRLDPPELGPMQVKVSVNQDQASITFTSPHPAVREALDQQLSRLREMFSEQGLNLVNVDVSDKSFAQQEREQEESAKNQNNIGVDEEELTPVALTQVISMRLVDHYA